MEKKFPIKTDEGNMSKPFFVFLFFKKRKTESLANSVPAAAVRQRGKVLSIWTGYKMQVGGNYSSFEKYGIYSISRKKVLFWKKKRGNGMA